MDENAATFESIWAGEPFYACQNHMNAMHNIANAMGVPMPEVKPYFGTELCQNCVNEEKEEI
jgi:hypothetical protein